MNYPEFLPNQGKSVPQSRMAFGTVIVARNELGDMVIFGYYGRMFPLILKWGVLQAITNTQDTLHKDWIKFDYVT